MDVLNLMSILISIAVFLALSTLSMPSAQENLALGKPAWQSSNYETKYSADLAVDGIQTHVLDSSAGFCTHTASEENPTWGVDLGDTYTVHSVRIYNRMNSLSCWNCQTRLGGFQIFVNDCPTCDKHLCFQDSSANLPLVITVTCDSPVTGRYLNISLPHRGVLALCEVEVYGDAFLGTSTGFIVAPSTETISTEALSSQTSGEVTVNTVGDIITEIIPTQALPSHISPEVTVNTVGDITATPCIDGCVLQRSDSSVLGSPDHDQPTSGTELLEASQPLVPLMSDVLRPSPATVLPFSSSIDLDSSIGPESTWNNTNACDCPCSSGPKSNDTKEDFMSSIIQNLEINTKNVSKRRRRYISAPDDRVSSLTIGCLGITMVVLIFGPIVLTDAVRMACFL